jgi:hypothetical protein
MRAMQFLSYPHSNQLYSDTDSLTGKHTLLSATASAFIIVYRI